MGKPVKTKRAAMAWEKAYTSILGMEDFNLDKIQDIVARTARVHGECPNSRIFEGLFETLKKQYLGNSNVNFRNTFLKKVEIIWGKENRERLAALDRTRTWK